MRRGLRTTAVLLAAALSGGCFWLQSTALELESIDAAGPRTQGAGETGAGADPDRVEPGQGPARDPDLTPLGEPAWIAVEPRIAVLPGGIRIAAGQFPTARTAHAQIILAHARPSAAGQGLARLVAELLADTPLERGARPSLRRAIENSGGRLEVRADAWTTTFAFTVPAAQWRRSVQLAAQALAAAPTSAERIDAWRRLLVREYGERWSTEALTTALRRVRSIELEGLPKWLEVLEDADLRAVRSFYSRVYLPARTTLVLAVPDAGPEAAIGHGQRAFEAWIAQHDAAALPAPVAALASASGLYWGRADGRSRFATAVDLPPSIAKDAAAQWVTAELLTGSATQSRFADALRGLATELQTELRQDGPTRFIELTGQLPPDQIAAIRTAVDLANASLQQRRPREDEIRTAARRAALRLAIDLDGGEGWCSEVGRSVLAGALPHLVIGPDGRRTELPSGPLFRDLLGALERPERIDLTAQLDAAARRSNLVVVVGADLTDPPPRGEMPGATIPAARRAVTAADLEEQTEAARAVLAAAMAAVGGAPALLGLGGFRAESLTRSGQGPEAVDAEWFRREGRYRRVRHLLHSVIETTVGPDAGIETCGRQRRDLSPVDRRDVLEDARRHPLLVLAEVARGTRRFRQTSLRDFHGRACAILDAEEDGSAPVQLWVDAESGLVRAVVSETDLGNGPVYRREEWRDYRSAGRGLRAPHHRTTWIDDGLQGTVTVYQRVLAEAPEAELLEPGGPLR
jgi:predicted Zn-dependent peptidase